MNPQPKALYVLFFVRMWECFSFYGMRALLALYMIGELGLGEGKALAMFALYSALVKLGGVMGGRVADQYLGLRKSIVLGGWIIAAGHLSLLFFAGRESLSLGLALIVVGSSLFISNISSLLGLFYEGKDERREKGYTLFYMGINLGALLAGILCAFAASRYGWNAGFGIAAFGMIAGNILFLVSGQVFEGKGEAPASVQPFKVLLGLMAAIGGATFLLEVSQMVNLFTPLFCVGLMALTLRKVAPESRKQLIVAIGAAVAYFSIEEMSGSSMILFAEKFTNPNLFGYTLPVSAVISLNPFVILLVGGILQKIQGLQEKRLAIGFGVSTLSLAALALFGVPGVSILLVCLAIGAIAAGEVLIGPYTYSIFAEKAPKESFAEVVGLVPLAFATAASMSGIFGQGIAMVGDYRLSFAILALFQALCGGILLYRSREVALQKV